MNMNGAAPARAGGPDGIEQSKERIAQDLILRIVQATEEAMREVREDAQRALADEVHEILAAAERDAELIRGGEARAGDAPSFELEAGPATARGPRLRALPTDGLGRRLSARVEKLVSETAAAADEAYEEALLDADRVRMGARQEVDRVIAAARRRAEAAERGLNRAQAVVGRSSEQLSGLALELTGQMVAIERSGAPADPRLTGALSEISSVLSRAGYELDQAQGALVEAATPEPVAEPARPRPMPERRMAWREYAEAASRG